MRWDKLILLAFTLGLITLWVVSISGCVTICYDRGPGYEPVCHEPTKAEVIWT